MSEKIMLADLINLRMAQLLDRQQRLHRYAQLKLDEQNYKVLSAVSTRLTVIEAEIRGTKYVLTAKRIPYEFKNRT